MKTKQLEIKETITPACRIARRKNDIEQNRERRRREAIRRLEILLHYACTVDIRGDQVAAARFAVSRAYFRCDRSEITLSRATGIVAFRDAIGRAFIDVDKRNITLLDIAVTLAKVTRKTNASGHYPRTYRDDVKPLRKVWLDLRHLQRWGDILERFTEVCVEA